MAFENLGDKLQNAFKDLRGRGKLSENDIDAALREVRRALLEADVNLRWPRISLPRSGKGNGRRSFRKSETGSDCD